MEALRKIGCRVHPTHQLGGGFPDLLVWRGTIPILMEVKDGRKPPSARKLTEDEQAFHDLFADMKRAGALVVVDSVQAAIDAVEAV